MTAILNEKTKTFLKELYSYGQKRSNINSTIYNSYILHFQMKSFFFILLAHTFCLGLASHLPYGEDFMGDYMFGYGVYANEYDQKQNFGQKEHRNEDEVMGEW